VESINPLAENHLRIHKVFATAEKRGKHFGKDLALFSRALPW
jgi:hypothetical protein